MKVDTKRVKITELVVGDIVVFSYDGDLKVARVLNPEWEEKMHALKLPDDISSVQLFDKEKLILMKRDVESRTKASELINNYGDASLKRSYRTYTVKKIRDLQKVVILMGDTEVDEDGLTYEERKQVVLSLINLVKTLKVVYSKYKGKGGVNG